MSTGDPLVAQLTAPGSSFAIGERDGTRCFTAAPDDLDALIDSARRFGPATMVVEGEHRFTYDEVFARADALAGALSVAPGERVAIAMRNRVAWMVGLLAVVRAGGVAVLVNSRGAAAELRAAIEECSPALVLADAERAGLIAESGYPGRVLSAGAFPETGEAPPPHRAAPNDPAAILFTSGTTGRVKGAVLTHRNLVHSLMSIQLSGLMVLHGIAAQYGVAPEAIMAQAPQPATLLVYPLFHISGLAAGFLSPMLSGGKIVIMRRWDPDEALRLIAQERITQLSAVPTMLWDLINRSSLEGADLSSLTNVASGGQALPVNLLDAVRAACPAAMMGTGYGMTETAGSVAMAVGADFIRKPSAAGRVLELAEVRILDAEGRDLPAGEAGEIVVRSPMVMAGYWSRPEETAAVLSPDGWLRTGDIGLVDDEGYVFIVDRKKDMVISGGENIYCAEVERVMGELPGVAECAAFGIPDVRLGELLVAVAVGEGIDEPTIIATVAERLARYKAPAQVAILDEPLPRNAVGKIDKIALRARWPKLIGD